MRLLTQKQIGEIADSAERRFLEWCEEYGRYKILANNKRVITLVRIIAKVAAAQGAAEYERNVLGFGETNDE